MVYHHISLVEEHLLCYGIDTKYTRWIWYREGDLNEVAHDDDDIEDDSDAVKPIKYDGIDSLLDDLHQGVHSNVSMSTSISEGSFDHKHNINEVEETYEQFVKLVRDAREPLYPNYVKFFKLKFLIKLLHIKIVSRWS